MNNNRPFAHTSSASFGIDKLMLTSQAFIIKDASQTGLQVKHGFTNLATGEQSNPFLFKDKTGRKIEGVSAFLNTEFYGLNINQFGVQINFNPSKAYHPFELCNDPKILQQRIENVSKDLYSKGIRLDIEQTKVSRIDLAKNSEMIHPCIAYGAVMSLLNINRAKRNAMYPDGHSSNNNKFGLNFYNKGKELRQDGIEIIPHDRMMRCELQYKSSQSVCKRTGISTLESLYEIGTENLYNLYKETLSQDVFKAGQSNQLQISYTDIKEIIMQLQPMYGRRTMEVLYSSYGIETLINQLGSVEHFESILKDLGYHRNTITKHKKRLMQYLNLQKIISKASGIGKLFKELHLKFAA